MPRNKTEASEQLELYKLVTKRQLIHKEIYTMEQRIQELTKELGLINNQIENTEKSIKEFRQATPDYTQSTTQPKSKSQPKSQPKPNNQSNSVVESNNFQTFYLEY